MQKRLQLLCRQRQTDRAPLLLVIKVVQELLMILLLTSLNKGGFNKLQLQKHQAKELCTLLPRFLRFNMK